ncbi:MAG TPA: ATP-dependent helicase HrpB [Isosphaeraceae bacterium]|nr:ATP-dependent helicase HrpB [Isosphaeraceae bacterium]
MTQLPIDPRLTEILAALERTRSLVLVAPPGAGKTTRVPPAIVRAGLLGPEHPALVLLQPRRVAARAAAARIAAEQGWTLGREVGYQVRFERRAAADTRLLVATEGILTRRLLANPFLEGVGAVVLDEFHERSLHTDLALALLREVRETVREDLILVVMSATLEAEPVAQFLGGCPIVTVEGRTFPVEVLYRQASTGALWDRVADAVREVLEAPTAPAGDILVFLPGWEEIERTRRRLEPMAEREGMLILPLHGRLPAEEQDRALRPADCRKVILATNVAETSLTIEGIGTVIDTGLARKARHDAARGLDRLVLVPISRASAEQRAGRAGRTAPGRCVRLWAEREHRGRPAFDEPEVRSTDLAATALALHAWGHADPASFAWFEAPPAESLAAAERVLAALGAIETEAGAITSVGRAMMGLPIHPRLAQLLLAAAEAGHLEQGAALAALLSEKDILLERRGAKSGPGRGLSPRTASFDRGRSDLLVRLDLLAEAEAARFSAHLRDRGIDPHAARQVARARDDLLRTARRFPGLDKARRGLDSVGEDDLLKLALLAYPDRVVRRRAAGSSSGVMVGGRGVRLDPESVVHEAELFLALDPREDRQGTGALEARVRVASAIELEWLEEFFPNSLRRDREVVFDPDRGRVVAVQRLWYRDLLLREDRNATPDPAEAERALAAAIADRALDMIRDDPAASAFWARVTFLRKWMPELEWPDLESDSLADILAPLAAGRQSLDEVRNVALVPILKGLFGSAQLRALVEHAPETLTVPSGSRIRLTYDPDGPPILAVRLQELFGWTDTPRLAAGRVPVLLHLLGPNFRPVQVTSDLRSFWSSTYFQVRKDLRARYPRHAWPEDPLTARPEAKGGRRMR